MNSAARSMSTAWADRPGPARRPGQNARPGLRDRPAWAGWGAGLAAGGSGEAGACCGKAATGGSVTAGSATTGQVATVGTAISDLAGSAGPGLRHPVARARPEVELPATAGDIRRTNGPQGKKSLRGDFIAAASHQAVRASSAA